MHTRGIARRSVATAVLLSAAAGTTAAQGGTRDTTRVPRRDTSRTIIVDSVQKTYGTPASAARASGAALPPDLARTVDAEVRVALFELAAGRELPALSRLERTAALVAQDSSGTRTPEQAALHFLLAQSYYRLGMLDAFAREAEAALAAGPSRYATVLRPQLVVAAYRGGDYARAATLARDLPSSETGLAALVGGLAAYQSRDIQAARAAFQRAAAAGGSFAGYARYMDAIAQLRADTTQAASALAALEAVATSATGDFADQARLTAAQVAYEGERYDDAVRLASAIAADSRLAAGALLTRGWALYKLERVDEAERAFSEFATRFPSRPEHDEAQLMAAQAQLERGRAADAERIFQQVADSAAVGVTAMQSQTNAAIGDVARAVVASRTAQLLVVGDPVAAKVMGLEQPSVDGAVLAVVTGTPPTTSPGATDSVSAAQPAALLVSVGTRLDSVAAHSPAGAARVLFAPASATERPRELAAQTQNLTAADASVAVARYRLDEQLAAQQRELALLASLASMVAGDSADITGLAASHQALADSLARLDQLMAAAEARLRELVGREIEATRTMAAENARTADSLRTALAAGATPEDRAALDAEAATAAAYARIAEMATTGLDSAIAHHPAFVMRDSVRAHGARARAILAELQNSWSTSRGDVGAALTALRGGDGPAVRAARQALADAEARRATAEGNVIAAVSAELSARAEEMVATLQRNTEAAQFGMASAAFFRAIDGTRAVGEAEGTSAVPATLRTPARRTASPQRRR